MKKRRDPKLVLNLLGIGTAVSLLGDAPLYAVLPHPQISSQLGISIAMVGVLLSVNRAARLVANGPIGLLYDRMPRRGLLIAGLFTGACSSIFFAAGKGFWPLLIGRVLWGLAWSLISVGGNSIVLDVSTDDNRGRHSGVYQMWFFIGVASSSLLGTMLIDLFGFSAGQWISVAIISAAAIVWFLFLPETRTKKAAGSVSAGKQIKTKDSGFPWMTMISASAVIFISRFVVWGILAATSILWLSDHFENGVQIAALLIPVATLTGIYNALRNLVSIGCAQLVGRISDKVGGRWPIIGLTMILGGLGLWLMGSRSSGLALFGAALVPVVGSSVETLVPAIAGDTVSKDMRSRALGFINTAGDLGATISPFAALGLLGENWISLGGIYQIAGSVFGLTAVVILAIFFSKTSKKVDPIS